MSVSASGTSVWSIRNAYRRRRNDQRDRGHAVCGWSLQPFRHPARGCHLQRAAPADFDDYRPKAGGTRSSFTRRPRRRHTTAASRLCRLCELRANRLHSCTSWPARTPVATYTMTGGTGTCSAIAGQAGKNNYLTASTVTQTVTAIPAGRTIAFPFQPGLAPRSIAITKGLMYDLGLTGVKWSRWTGIQLVAAHGGTSVVWCRGFRCCDRRGEIDRGYLTAANRLLILRQTGHNNASPS